MEPLSLDTPLHVEQLWIAGLRKRGPLWRWRCLVDMTSFCWQATQSAYQHPRPEATLLEQEAWLLCERYGNAVAHGVIAFYKSQLHRALDEAGRPEE